MSSSGRFGAAPISVRPAVPGDREFVLATASRLSDFGPPRWRSAAEVVEGEARTLRAYFDSPGPSTILFLAEGADREPLGFAYLETLRDYFTREEHGHVGILAVTKEAEGRGAGGALLDAGEAWSRGLGYRRLTLNVFFANAHARRVYERRGFEAESLRYVRNLTDR
jgi:GNAT superfamily N-acetyltransferase